MSIKKGIFEMIGRTIKAVIVNEECDPYPNYHVFIVFDDNQTYEFFGEGRIHSTSGLYNGPGYAKAFTNCRKIKRYSKDEKGREKVEDITGKSRSHEKQQKKEKNDNRQ
jgi:hypothetical protein